MNIWWMFIWWNRATGTAEETAMAVAAGRAHERCKDEGGSAAKSARFPRQYGGKPPTACVGESDQSKGRIAGDGAPTGNA